MLASKPSASASPPLRAGPLSHHLTCVCRQRAACWVATPAGIPFALVSHWAPRSSRLASLALLPMYPLDPAGRLCPAHRRLPSLGTPIMHPLPVPLVTFQLVHHVAPIPAPGPSPRPRPRPRPCLIHHRASACYLRATAPLVPLLHPPCHYLNNHSAAYSSLSPSLTPFT